MKRKIAILLLCITMVFMVFAMPVSASVTITPPFGGTPINPNLYLGLYINTMVYTSPAIELMTYAVTSGKYTNYDKAQAIYNWVKTNIRYELTDNYDKNVAPTVYQNKKAQCWGYANLVAAMCRFAGVPCCVLYGDVPYAGGTTQYHAWNAIYTGSDRWVMLDATWGMWNTSGLDTWVTRISRIE